MHHIKFPVFYRCGYRRQWQCKILFHESFSVSFFFSLSGGIFSKNFTVLELLNGCPGQAAFSENLHVEALATDGTNRLYGFDYHDIITNTDRNYDAYDTNAFALSNT